MRLFSMRSLIILCWTQSTSQCELPWCHGINLMHNRLVSRATQITSLSPRTSNDTQRSRGTISSRSLSANRIEACGCDFISSAIPLNQWPRFSWCCHLTQLLWLLFMIIDLSQTRKIPYNVIKWNAEGYGVYGVYGVYADESKINGFYCERYFNLLK